MMMVVVCTQNSVRGSISDLFRQRVLARMGKRNRKKEKGTEKMGWTPSYWV